MPRIKKNIDFIHNGVKYILDASLLHLDTDYMDIYEMEYLRRPAIILQEIQEKFHIYALARYFGSRRNLSCIQTRDIYHQMLEYFMTLFEQKMYQITNIDINTLNDNDEYTCMIAECLSTMRACIRKYTRYRTVLNQPDICSKNTLNKQNSGPPYKCPYPINDTTLCPTFKQALNRQKTCKKVIEKAKTTNQGVNVDVRYTMLLAFSPPYNNKSRNLGVSIPKNTHTIFHSKRNKTTRTSKRSKRTGRKKNIKKTIINNTRSIEPTNINNYETIHK
jgi:hypothetical protein